MAPAVRTGHAVGVTPERGVRRRQSPRHPMAPYAWATPVAGVQQPFPRRIAEYAGICQIVEGRSSTVLAAHDMIDLVRETSIVFVDEAVFATMSRAAGYASTDLLANVTSHGRGSGGT